MGPGADEQGGVASGLPQPGVLVEGLVDQGVVPSGDQARRDAQTLGRPCQGRAVPVRVASVRVRHHVVQPRHVPESGRVRPAQRPRGDDVAHTALEAQRRPGERPDPPILVGHPQADEQRVLQPEGAVRVEQGVRVVQPHLYHHGLQFRRRVQGERPLHVPQIAGADRPQRPVEPGPPAQPGHRGQAVGGLVAPQIERTARAAGAAAALEDHVEPLLGEEHAVHGGPGQAPAVRRTHQESGEVAGRPGEVVVGDQRTAVGGRHHQPGLPSDVVPLVRQPAPDRPHHPRGQRRLPAGRCPGGPCRSVVVA